MNSAAVAVGAFSNELPRAAAATGPVTLAIQLTPAGDFKPSDGRDMQVDLWRIDAAIAARVIARYRNRKTPPVVDYEHQTLKVETNGQPALAAGWIADLEWREGSGLWARVEFTDRATRHIAAKEYRYVSPVFRYDAKTGEVLELMMAAITNTPAIDGMAAMELMAAASSMFTTEQTMQDQTHGLTPEELDVLARTGVKPAEYAAAKRALEVQKKRGEEGGVPSTDPDPDAYGGVRNPRPRPVGVLTAQERAICQATGITDAAFLAAANPPTSALTDDERAICRATGISETAFIAARA